MADPVLLNSMQWEVLAKAAIKPGYEFGGVFTHTTGKLFTLELVTVVSKTHKGHNARFLVATDKGHAALKQGKGGLIMSRGKGEYVIIDTVHGVDEHGAYWTVENAGGKAS